jgi:hypothetical protein
MPPRDPLDDGLRPQSASVSRKETPVRMPKIDIGLAAEELAAAVTAVIVDQQESVDAERTIMREKSWKARNLVANHSDKKHRAV